MRRSRFDLLGNLLDDAGVGVEQIIARHPRFAGDSCSNHHDVRVVSLFVAVRADDARVKSFDRSRLPLIEPLALGNPFHHVYHHDGAGELFFGYALRGGRTDIASADHRYLVDHYLVGVLESCARKLSDARTTSNRTQPPTCDSARSPPICI